MDAQEYKNPKQIDKDFEKFCDEMIEELNKTNICGNINCKIFNKEIKLKICSKCKKIKYCSVECQRKDWKKHRKICKSKITYSSDLHLNMSNRFDLTNNLFTFKTY